VRTAAARTGRNLFPACGLSTHVSKDVGDPSRGCRALVETYGQYNALASGRTDTVKGALSPGRSACSAAAGSIGRRVPARLIPVSARTSPPGGSHASRVHEVDGGSGGEWSRPTCVRPSPSADAVGARRDDHLKSLNRHRTDEDGLSVAVLCTAFCAATGCTEGETASARDRGVAGPLRAGVAARNGASRGFVRLDREPVRRAVRRPVRNCRGGRCESALFWRAGRVPGAARAPAILRRPLRRRGRTVRR
jgi:hypothetical protein